MSRRESDLWSEMYRALSHLPLHHFQRIENSCSEGVPDVEFCINGVSGWIELKRLHRGPVRPDTVLKVDHFSGGQRAWLMRRATCRGRCFVLLRVDQETFLFSGGHAAAHLGNTWTMADCRAQALFYWDGERRAVPWRGLAERLIG